MSELRIGVIGGSGVGHLFAEEAAGVVHVIDTPFGPPSAPVHEVRWHDARIYLLPRHGVGHVLPPSAVPYRANVYAMKKLGVTHVLATGAVGSLRQEFAPRDLVIVDQVIDKTFRRPGTFYDNVAVHVEFASPFCPTLRKLLTESAEGTDTQAHAGGCYVAMEGPAFSTRAEAHMHRLWGGDVVGMTAMPEARLAREAEIAYALVALVTDYDSWRTPPPPAEGADPKPSPDVLLEEIRCNLKFASDKAIALVRRAIERAAAEPARVADCPAHGALARAIWTDRAHIPAAEVERLAALWVHYFVPPAG